MLSRMTQPNGIARVVTPPYATHKRARGALGRPPFTNRFERYELAVVQCDYACPRSGLGDFSWPR